MRPPHIEHATSSHEPAAGSGAHAVASHPATAQRPGAGPRRKRNGGTDTQRRPPNRPAKIDGFALLSALRYRWKLAIALALSVAAVAGGGVFAALDRLQPRTFTTFALLRVSSEEPRLVFNTTEKESEFHTYRSIQATLIKSPLVMNAALNQADVAALKWVRESTDPVTKLNDLLKVDFPGDSELLRIAITGDDSEQLPTLVDAVTDSYLENVVHTDRKRRLTRLQELERVYEETEEKARAKRSLTRQLARTLGTSDSKVLTLKQQMAVEHFAELKREHTRVQFDLMRAQVRERTRQGAVDKTLADAGSAGAEFDIVNPILNDYVQRDAIAHRLCNRIFQLQDLITQYEKVAVQGDEPSLVEARVELEAVQRLFAARDSELRRGAAHLIQPDPQRSHDPNNADAEREIALLTEQEKTLRERIDSQAAEVDRIGTTSSELELLRAESEQMETVTKRIHSELESLRVELQSPPRVTLLQRAEVWPSLEKTRHGRVAALSASVCFVAVVLIVGVLEFLSRRVRTSNDVEIGLGLSVVGELPAVRLRSDGSMVVRGSKNPYCLRLGVPAGDDVSEATQLSLAHSPMIESADAISAVILRSGASVPTRVLMVTSAEGGEGKTTLASCLAVSLARAGRRTLLVDCDLCHPSLDRLFGVRREPGLRDALCGQAEIAAAIHATNFTGLSIMPAGHGERGRVVQALSRGKLKELREWLDKLFDFVVIDTSAILLSADPLWVGRHVDAAVMSVLSGTSRLPRVHAAHARLARLGIRVLGAVVHNARGEFLATLAPPAERVAA